MKKIILFVINLVTLLISIIIWTLATSILIEGWKKCESTQDSLSMLLLTVFYLAMSFKMFDHVALMVGVRPAKNGEVNPKSKTTTDESIN